MSESGGISGSPEIESQQGKGLALLALLGSLMVALVGFARGKWAERPTGLSLGQLAFFAGGFLALAGLGPRPARGERLVAGCLLAYIVLAGAVEPLEFISDVPSFIVSMTWPSPLIVGGVLLPVRGCWRTGLGCWAVLFSGMAALGYNVSHAYSGRGFLIAWMS